MKLTAAPGPFEEAVDLLGLIAFEDDFADGDASPPSNDQPSIEALIRESAADQRFKGKVGQTLVIHTQHRIPARRIAVVGAGARSAFRPADYRHAAAALARAANTVGARSLFLLDDTQGPIRRGQAAPLPAPSNGSPGGKTPPTVRDENGGRTQRPHAAAHRRLESVAQGLVLGGYRFERYMAEDKRAPAPLNTVRLQTTSDLSDVAAASAIERGERVARATSYARDLVNEPAGTMTPTALAENITNRATNVGLEVTVLGRQQCLERGMGMFLAVAQGSQQEPKFIHVAWRPPGASRKVVLVGKGVTFDSGGLSLKTNEGMLEMKIDMAGAAAVLSSILVAAEEKLGVEVHALAACTENMPSGTAYKLGDVLRSMSGKTVEINNTDAEGRLTLGDALTYGLELKPDLVIDFATLTGACVVALGPHTAGVMSNDEPAVKAWMAAASDAGEDMWQLPLPARLTEQLKSEIADMRNTGERWGGALTAGLFLREFVGSTPWIHVDLAGPAAASKEWGCFNKGGTGFAVATIVEYLRGLVAAAPS